jgi:hypothetical protein
MARMLDKEKVTEQKTWWPHAVAHVWDPSYSGAQSSRITWAQEFQATLDNIARPHVLKKN